MAKLTDIKIREKDGEQYIAIDTPVNVTKEGLFTTTLPKEAVDTLSQYGIKMDCNRLGNPGYFEADTLNGLERKIHAFVKECISRTLIEEKIILKYDLCTNCHYVKDTDGELVPNGYWVKNPDDMNKTAHWREGTEGNNAISSRPAQLSLWVKPYHKKRYAYASGKEITIYEPYKRTDEFARGKAPLDWLASLINIAPTRGLFSETLARYPEVEATDENCRFFVSMMKFIFKANELLKDFALPENILDFIEQNRLPELEQSLR